MRDYIVAVDENGQPYLAHAGENGGWKNRATKYLGKFPNLYGNGKTAYAYTQQQLRAMQNYARGGARKAQNAVSNTTKNFDQARRTLKSDLKKRATAKAAEKEAANPWKQIAETREKKPLGDSVSRISRLKSSAETAYDKKFAEATKKTYDQTKLGQLENKTTGKIQKFIDEKITGDAPSRDMGDAMVRDAKGYLGQENAKKKSANNPRSMNASMDEYDAATKERDEAKKDFNNAADRYNKALYNRIGNAGEVVKEAAKDSVSNLKSKSDRMKEEFRKKKEEVKDKLDDVQDTAKEVTGYGAKERLGTSNLIRAREEVREARKRQDTADIRARIAQENAAMYDAHAKSTLFGKKKAQEVADEAKDKYDKAKEALERAEANSAHAQEVYDNLSKDAKKYDSSIAKKIDDAKSKADEVASSSKRSKYSEYKENDPDFDDKNYDEKNRVGDTDFFSFKGKDGRTVIVEEDMKWTLPKGVDPNSPEIHAALKKFASQVESAREMNNSAYTGQEWRDAVTEAIDDASREALKKK